MAERPGPWVDPQASWPPRTTITPAEQQHYQAASESDDETFRPRKRAGYCEIHPMVKVQDTGCWAWCCGADEAYCEYCAMADYRKKEAELVKTPEKKKPEKKLYRSSSMGRKKGVASMSQSLAGGARSSSGDGQRSGGHRSNPN